MRQEDKNVPNKKLSEGGRTLDDGETDGLNVKLEEDSWDANVVADFPLIVRHTVLVRMQRLRARCDVCGWDDSKVVLICNKICKLSHVTPTECMNGIPSCVTSKELSRGWVISGKCLPKENSVMTWERFMTMKQISTCIERRVVTRTAVIDMNVTTVAMAEGSNVKVG